MSGDSRGGERVPDTTVRDMYDATAHAYAAMMDSEIMLPVYADTLGRLETRITGFAGPLVDVACGSGHMLSMFHEQCDPERGLLGIDASPVMVEIAGKKLGSAADVRVGDMRVLVGVPDGSAAALINFFSIHHLDPDGVRAALTEAHRVLRPGGQLVLAAWEGEGEIDYGEETGFSAVRYKSADLSRWTEDAGFTIARCVVEPVEGLDMDAAYIEGTKNDPTSR